MRCPQREEGVGRGDSGHARLRRMESQLSVTSLPPPPCPLLFCPMLPLLMSLLSINMIIFIIAVLLILFFHCCVVMSLIDRGCLSGCVDVDVVKRILYAVLDFPSSSLIASMSSSFSFDSSFLISSRMSCFNLS